MLSHATCTAYTEDAAQLYKFHGGYQQDDREKRSFGAGKFYQFMMRTKQPAGKGWHFSRRSFAVKALFS